MNIKEHDTPAGKIAEILSTEVIIGNPQEALDLIGDLYYQGFDGIVLNEKNFNEQFFTLQNGLAGEILQKFTNYRMKLAIVGHWKDYSSKSLKDFIFESNKGNQNFFTFNTQEALEVLGKN